MQFFQRLFGPKNPTQGWVVDPTLRWLVDLDACLFCGVSIGAPLQQLQPFGPAQIPDGSGRLTALLYPTYGFSFYLDDQQRLETVDINMAAEEDMVAFAGRWTYEGRGLTLRSTTTPAEVREMFAALTPTHESDTFLAYQLPRVLLMFEWDEGRLENILLDTKSD